jgi:hypothetical protein
MAKEAVAAAFGDEAAKDSPVEVGEAAAAGLPPQGREGENVL